MKNLHRRCLDAPRWKSKFARFVLAYGVANLATQMEVRPGAVYHWISARTAPRRGHAAIIRRLAREFGVKLSLDQIYSHSTRLVAVDRDPAMPVPRERILARVREVTLRRSGG
ncbi:MAG: acyl carrier protein [Candidatus Acidiferrum sp.]